MIDPIAVTATALATQGAAPVGIVFLAGLFTSIGPCIAPRYVAVVALAQGTKHPTVSTAAFVLGLVSAFLVLGSVAGALGAVWSWSRSTDLLLAGGLFVGGCLSLIRARPSAPGATGCEHDARPGAYRSLGAVYLLGASSALVVSPCCTPVVAGIVAVAAATGKPVVGCALMMALGAYYGMLA